ncbi:MAG TPA: M23 family peptidase, partial [Burkholderiales bacterium]|nr:M23 family peptidase [Burkholderiales bacterium]
MRTPHFLIGIATGLALAGAVPASQGDLPLTAPVPGGVAIVCVGRAPGPAPQVVFDGQRVLVARVGDIWHAVVGLPLALRPGAHELSVLEGERTARAIPFKVGKRDYETQRVTLADRRQVDPEPEDLRR